MATHVQIAARKVSSVNPASRESLRDFECASDEEVHDAVTRARSAQPGWSELGIRRRIDMLRNFQRLLLERKTQVAQLITREAGKPYAEAVSTEILVVLDSARFYIDQAF